MSWCKKREQLGCYLKREIMAASLNVQNNWLTAATETNSLDLKIKSSSGRTTRIAGDTTNDHKAHQVAMKVKKWNKKWKKETHWSIVLGLEQRHRLKRDSYASFASWSVDSKNDAQMPHDAACGEGALTPPTVASLRESPALKIRVVYNNCWWGHLSLIRDHALKLKVYSCKPVVLFLHASWPSGTKKK